MGVSEDAEFQVRGSIELHESGEGDDPPEIYWADNAMDGDDVAYAVQGSIYVAGGILYVKTAGGVSQRALKMDTFDADFWSFGVANSSSAFRKFMYPSNATSDGTVGDSYSYIGSYDNSGTWTGRPLTALQSYYLWGGDGSNSAPTLSFYGDSNTGFYRIASGRVGFSGDGTKHVEFGAGNLGGHSASFYNSGASEFDAAIYYDGYVTGSTAHALSLNASTNQVLRASSSLRYKKEVRDIGELIPTNTVWDLQPKAFKWNEDTGTPNEQDAGLIAEEVHKINPYLAVVNKEGQPEAVRYAYIPLLLLEEMKKLRTRIKQLEEKS